MSVVRLAAKDLVLEWRSRELLDAALLGALALAVVAGVSLASVPDTPERTAAVLWIGATLTAMLPLARSFTGEADRGTLEVLLLLPVERGQILVGKVLSNLLFTVAGMGVVALAYAGVFGATFDGWPGLVPIALLGALGVSLVGSALAAIAAQARGREALLPVLLAPLLLPVLLSAIPASIHALRGDPVAAFGGELALLAGYDLLFLAAGWALFDVIAEG
ncbi:MAG TPA: heme exporter protein CcmB [Candidatus Thermoplasmatota archaeon]|jgi:heme exporter protein B|nr:heme exporter protein CcmB [Candidatus Thermoplasmatota archaeon]